MLVLKMVLRFSSLVMSNLLLNPYLDIILNFHMTLRENTPNRESLLEKDTRNISEQEAKTNLNSLLVVLKVVSNV